MANNATKTEHTGPKRGRGAYYGHKVAAKHESNKSRRRNNRGMIKEQIEDINEKTIQR
jgi:hypothetical protein